MVNETPGGIKAEESAQSAMWDREVDVPGLEEALDRAEKAKAPAKEYTKARRDLKALLGEVALQDGERVRVGRFVLTGKARNGGGFEIPAWTSIVVGGVQALD